MFTPLDTHRRLSLILEEREDPDILVQADMSFLPQAYLTSKSVTLKGDQ